MVVFQSYTVAVVMVSSPSCAEVLEKPSKTGLPGMGISAVLLGLRPGRPTADAGLRLHAGQLRVQGRSFLADLAQADLSSLLCAFTGGLIFNVANILLVRAMDIAGIAVAFPVGIGLTRVLGGQFALAAGGKDANQAVAAARAGTQVTFIARVGKDLFGKNALQGGHLRWHRRFPRIQTPRRTASRPDGLNKSPSPFSNSTISRGQTGLTR